MKLEGWRLVNRQYQPIPGNEKGWLWCEQLGVWLGTWEGTFQGKPFLYLRFHDVEHQRAEFERQRAEAEIARLKAPLEQLQRPQTQRRGFGS